MPDRGTGERRLNVDAFMEDSSHARPAADRNPLAEAEEWFARLRDGGTDSDREAFGQWRNDPRNATAWAHTTALWEGLGALGDDPGLERMVKNAMLATRPHRRPRWPVAAAIAACLVIALSVTVVFIRHAMPPTPSTYATGPLQRETITLPDGSKVTLNADTRIEARFGAHRRDLTLAQGEALFDVVHDENAPFTVTTGGSEIIDLGTQFQVSNVGRRVTVTLLEGSIAIDRAKTGEHVRLHPGQQATYAVGTGPIDTREVDVQVVSSWAHGRLLFRGTPLAGVIAEVNRYSRTPIELADPSLASIPVSGTFPTGDSRSVALGLQAMLPLRVDTSTPGRIVLHRR